MRTIKPDANLFRGVPGEEVIIMLKQSAPAPRRLRKDEVGQEQEWNMEVYAPLQLIQKQLYAIHQSISIHI